METEIDISEYNNNTRYTQLNEIVLISHTDLDGYGCNLVLRSQNLEDRCEINCIYENVSNIDSDGKIYDTIWNYIKTNTLPLNIFITDLAPKREDVIELINHFNIDYPGIIHVIDHHDTSSKLLSKYKWCSIRSGSWMSGTELFYQYIRSCISDDGIFKNSHEFEMICNIVHTISRYDTWAWKTDYRDGSEVYMNAIFGTYSNKLAFVDDIYDFITNSSDCSINSLYEKYERDIDNYKCSISNSCKRAEESAIPCKLQEYNCLLLISEGNVSEVSEYLKTKYQNADIIITLSPKEHSCSLRSNKNDINLGRLARYLSTDGNGGGHCQAAGCVLKPHFMLKLIEFYYMNIECNYDLDNIDSKNYNGCVDIMLF